MKLFLIVSLFILSSILTVGCTTIVVPKGKLAVINKDALKTDIYDTPTKLDGKFEYANTVPVEAVYEALDKDNKSMYCISPKFYLELREFVKEFNKQYDCKKK